MNNRLLTPVRSRAAFTLLELSVVLLLVGILAAVAIPRWTDAIDDFRVNSAARRLTSDLALAQTTALTSSRSQTLSFSLTGHSYELVNVSSLDRNTGIYKTRLSEEPYRSRIVSLFGSSSDQQLSFNGFGVPNRGGTIVLACGSKQRTIVLDSESGQAQLQE